MLILISYGFVDYYKHLRVLVDEEFCLLIFILMTNLVDSMDFSTMPKQFFLEDSK